MAMAETRTKSELLARMQAEYERFEALLSTLSGQQMTATGANSPWSVKDTIAHLTVWQGYLLDQLQGVANGKQPAAFMPELPTEDEINEHFYHVNKDRPLAALRADFQNLFARVLESVQAMSEETLKAPFPWHWNDRLVWVLTAHNTYEHFWEHGDNIRRWLDSVPH
jgi:hypothetical protein